MMAGRGSVKLSIYSTFDDKGTKKAQSAMKRFAKEYGTMNDATKALELDPVTRALAEQSIQADMASAKWAGYSSTLGSVGSKMTAGVTVPIVAAGAATVAAAVDIDSSLTSVKKTVDGTEEQYRQLKDAAIEFSETNAVSASQILDIQALGAQLGFAIDELDEFGRVVSGLDIATNMDAETAATEMAQFANITKMGHGEISNYGSAIVGLGNSFATTESDISSMAMRIAAAGTQVGMSQADILGLATALSSMGVEAEAGGTAISTVMAQIDKDVATNSASVETWASTAGMSAQEFADAWRNDPVDALSALLSNMESTTAEGGNMSVMLEELGIDSVRQTDIMKRLAGNSELVGSAVAKSNEEWTKNSALQSEVDNRNQSLASRMKIVENRAVAMAEKFGGPLADAMLDSVEAAEPLFEALSNGAKAFAEMDEGQQRAIIGALAAAAAMGPLVSVGGKVAGTVSTCWSAYGKLSAGLAKFSSKSKDAARAAETVNTGMGALAKGAGAALAVTAVAVAVNEIISAATGLDEANSKFDASCSSISSYADACEVASSMVTNMDAVLTSSGTTVGEVSGVIGEHEAAITAIISAAIAEQRALRDDELQSIREHNAEIERLEAEKVTAYSSGMQGVTAAVNAEGSITQEHSAKMLATAQDFHDKGIASIDEYYNSRLMTLTQAFSVEGSMTQQEYDQSISELNRWIGEQKASLDEGLSNTKLAIAESTETITGFTDEQKAAVETLSAPYWKFEADVTRALGALVTDQNASFMAMQASIADNGGKVSAENAAMVEAILQSVEKLPPGMKEQADQAMRALARGLDADLGIDVANSTADEIIAAYRSKTGVAEGAGRDTSAAYASGFASNAQAALDAAAAVTGASADQLAQFAAAAGIKGDEAVGAFAAAIANGETIAEAAALANSSAATAGLSTDGASPGAAGAADYAMAIGGTAWLSQQQAALVAQSGVTGFGSVDMTPSGSTAGGQYAEGVGSQAEPSKKAGASLADNANSGASSVDGSSAGDWFAQGFVGAIGNWIQSAWDVGAALVNAALGGGNAAQQTGSPAKKTREMMKWYALGYIEEEANHEDAAYAAGRSLASASLSGTEDALRGAVPAVLPNVQTRSQVTPLVPYGENGRAVGVDRPIAVECKIENPITTSDIYDAVSAAMSSGKLSVALYLDGRELYNAAAAPIGARLGAIERRKGYGL